MPKGTVTNKNGDKTEYETTYIDKEIQDTMTVRFDPVAVFSQNLRAHELGVLIYMLSMAAINPQEQLKLSGVLEHFAKDDDIDLLEGVVKILERGLLTVTLSGEESLEGVVGEIKRTIFDLVLDRKQRYEKEQRAAIAFNDLSASRSEKLH